MKEAMTIERPILFGGAMVRAILVGRKPQRQQSPKDVILRLKTEQELTNRFRTLNSVVVGSRLTQSVRGPIRTVRSCEIPDDCPNLEVATHIQSGQVVVDHLEQILCFDLLSRHIASSSVFLKIVA